MREKEIPLQHSTHDAQELARSPKSIELGPAQHATVFQTSTWVPVVQGPVEAPYVLY